MKHKQPKKPAMTKRHQARREVALKNLEARLVDPTYAGRGIDQQRSRLEQERDVLRQRLGKGA